MAKGSFDMMKAQGSRLPWSDVDKLINEWKLSGALHE